MTHARDFNRREKSFATSKVKDVLPEYYLADNPKLVSFLETYYEFLDSDVSGDFKSQINDLFLSRDIGQTNLDNLDRLINEIGNGLQVASFFQQPRLMARLLGQFYRSKGSLVSAEGFFRAFFNEEVTIEYPKRQMLTINDADNNFLDHQIGFESQKFIQDNRLYQVFSILIKSGLSVIDYENLYKQFVHPAGFYFAGEVLAVGTALASAIGTGVSAIDSGAPATIFVSEVVDSANPGFFELTALLDSAGDVVRSTFTDTIDRYQSIPINVLAGMYGDVNQIFNPNSFTFDAESDGISVPDMSMDVETMDNTIFTRYLSDSTY